MLADDLCHENCMGNCGYLTLRVGDVIRVRYVGAMATQNVPLLAGHAIWGWQYTSQSSAMMELRPDQCVVGGALGVWAWGQKSSVLACVKFHMESKPK